MTVDVERVWFTFPDGVFSYECRGCGDCCKGLGIGFDAASGELDALLDAYPPLLAFVRQRGEAWTAINPRGRCFFLDEGGMCRVEVERGREAKPAACRLFPFNRVFRLGGWTIVDYNSVICPLRAEAAEASAEEVGLSGRVRHADVLAEIGGIKDRGMVGTRLELEGSYGSPEAFVKAERAVQAACLVAASAATARGVGEGLDAALAAQVGAAQEALRRRRVVSEALTALLGRPWRPPGESTLRAALWLTPSMRFNELFGPRRWSDAATRARLLGSMWLVWLDALADGEALAGRGLTMQEATSLWSAQAPIAYLLSRWDEAPVIEPGEIELEAQGERRDRAMAFARACVANRQARASLGSLAGVLFGDRPAVERVATLRGLESTLGRIEFRPERRSRRP